jgi:tetratricopeptide (TPR) repeat protein
LDVARTVNLALERWEACLGVVTESEETQRAMGAEEPELARARANRYGPLLRLGRLDEAQKVLESSLAFFRQVGDLLAEATTLSALAEIWAEREDRVHAAGLERQALSVLNRLSDLAGRSDSHFNLANYFDRLGTAGEAVRHRLAALAYDLIMGRRQGLAIVLHNLAILMRSAEALGRQYNLPRLAELLARPEFEPLQRTLTEWNVALDELQAEIDELVEEVRRGVEVPPEEGAGA